MLFHARLSWQRRTVVVLLLLVAMLAYKRFGYSQLEVDPASETDFYNCMKHQLRHRDPQRVFDAIVFNSNLDVLEMHLRELDSTPPGSADVVHKFIIVESNFTFSGKPKPLHFNSSQSRFKKFLHKIVHVIVDHDPVPEQSTLAAKWRTIHSRTAEENARRSAILGGVLRGL
jgi:hypothetical protein